MENAFDKLLNNDFFEVLYKKDKHYYFYNKRIKLYQKFTKSNFRNMGCLFTLAPMKYWKTINSHKNGRLHIKNCAALLEESFYIK